MRGGHRYRVRHLSAAYAIIPDATLAFFGTLFHGLDIRKVAVPMTWGGVVVGLLVAVVGAYLLTLLWATWYNRMLGTNSDAGGTHSCCKQ